MSKNNLLRQLLPNDKEVGNQYLRVDAPTKQRRNVSLACTECQKKRSKVRTIVPLLDARTDLAKCSCTTPCTTCMTGNRKCLYDPNRDRRRKTHTAELLNFRVAFCQMVAKLRSGTLEEIYSLIQEIQNMPTDQEVVDHLVQGHGPSSNV
ncbi:uncharacterized protein N7506_000217 [Penicillium brevicompactum]|uniref:uncharacterized protein n=1 Tax=Penicillium brevicompactum TaxID=5074 RepID=UPI0025400749|nr:uncharacterized protein N7506_000217 [Penicillium brevicompactum]KAJ5346964.1 hypothetical protein N7506_000217 [Penicillium brevicompactum]